MIRNPRVISIGLGHFDSIYFPSDLVFMIPRRLPLLFCDGQLTSFNTSGPHSVHIASCRIVQEAANTYQQVPTNNVQHHDTMPDLLCTTESNGQIRDTELPRVIYIRLYVRAHAHNHRFNQRDHLPKPLQPRLPCSCLFDIPSHRPGQTHRCPRSPSQALAGRCSPPGQTPCPNRDTRRICRSR